jgi:hypothetical protein
MATVIWAAVGMLRKCLPFSPIERPANLRVMNPSEACGGPNRLSVYGSTSPVTVFAVPTVQTTNLPGKWQYSRCLAYVSSFISRDMSGIFSLLVIANLVLFGSSRIRLYSLKTTRPKIAFHYAQLMVIPRRVWSLEMSAVRDPRSGEFTTSLRYSSLGCGDVADITTNGGTTAPETDCAMACSGDPSHLCGGAQRLQLYLWNGNLNNWQTPSNTGGYEVRVPLSYTCVCAPKDILHSTSFPGLYLRCLPLSE